MGIGSQQRNGHVQDRACLAQIKRYPKKKSFLFIGNVEVEGKGTVAMTNTTLLRGASHERS